MNATQAEQRAVLNGALAHASASGLGKSEEEPEPQWYWLRELNRQFPNDPGCLAPLYLNLLHLRPGQALFMKAGILHAYLRGTGLEIMANSDNVLRGGCTEKHVDVRELLSVLTFHAEKPILLNRSEQGWYESFVPEFQLASMNLAAGQNLELRTEGGLGERMGIILMTAGSLSLQTDESEFPLRQGEAIFISAAGDSEGAISSSSSRVSLSTSLGTSLGASFALATVNSE